MGTWRGSIVAALAATLGRPAWWSMALAAFLVRGGIVIVILPIVALPSTAALASALAPTIEGFAFGGLTPERLLLVLVVGAALFVVLGGGGLAGAWLDLAQLREAADDEELDLAWEPVQPSLRKALALRLAAHLPTLAATGYAAVRLVAAAYDELLAPGDAAVPIFLRVAQRAPDALALLLVAWLVGETVGGLAARRAAAGEGSRAALWRSMRQLFSRRGLATLALTTTVVGGVLVPFLLAAGRAWDHLRTVLSDGSHFLQVGAALLVLVASWILGLAVLGAVLAWRGAAWTAEAAPARNPARDPSVSATREATAGQGT
jgi:hypothetical protein